ncbi:insulin-like 3 (Leydig cell) [Polymixia lowei]
MSGTKCLPFVMILLVAGVCVIHGQDRIKMCGRELIRLAISSCGNSRVRRSVPELGQYHGNPQRDKDELSLAPRWYPLSSRVRRAAGKMSDICCEKGCSLRELIQFC